MQHSVIFTEEQVRDFVARMPIEGLRLAEFALLLLFLVKVSPGRLGCVARMMNNAHVGGGIHKQVPADLLPLPEVPLGLDATRIVRAMQAGSTIQDIRKDFTKTVAVFAVAAWTSLIVLAVN